MCLEEPELRKTLCLH